MHLGFSFMNTPFDPPVVELAKALEERGYESLWTGEHSHIPVELKIELPEAFAGDHLRTSHPDPGV